MIITFVVSTMIILAIAGIIIVRIIRDKTTITVRPTNHCPFCGRTGKEVNHKEARVGKHVSTRSKDYTAYVTLTYKCPWCGKRWKCEQKESRHERIRKKQ